MSLPVAVKTLMWCPCQSWLLSIGRIAQQPGCGYDSRNSRLSGRLCPPVGAEVTPLVPLLGCLCLPVGA